MINMICWCGNKYKAKQADLNRGWGLSCCKSHAAIRRDFEKPAATREDEIKISRVKKKDRGANRVAKDTRVYAHQEEEIGHPLDSGYFGHGQS